MREEWHTAPTYPRAPYPGAVPPPELPWSPPPTLSRRTVVRGGLGLAGLTATATTWADRAPTRRGLAAPEVAVVGAGLAGLTCAYELARHGVACTLYEANPDRLGGRCWTSRGWAHGQTAEHGGEFIDTVHHSLRRLVAELGLELDDLRGLPDTRPSARDRYFLRGARRAEGAVYAGYHRLRAAADRDAPPDRPVHLPPGRTRRARARRTHCRRLAPRRARRGPSVARGRDEPVHGRGVRARPRPPQRDQHGDGVRQPRAALPTNASTSAAATTWSSPGSLPGCRQARSCRTPP